MRQVGYPRTLFNGAYCLLVYCLVNFQPASWLADSARLVAACLQLLPVALVPLVVERQWLQASQSNFAVPNEPSLPALFQRPPPILSL